MAKKTKQEIKTPFVYSDMSTRLWNDEIKYLSKLIDIHTGGYPFEGIIRSLHSDTYVSVCPVCGGCSSNS